MSNARSLTRGVRLTTPVGDAIYPRLNTPDTKFDTDGVYSTRLALEGEEAEALIETINGVIQREFDAQKEALIREGKPAKAKALKLAADRPYKPLLDEATGEETGKYSFNIKLRAKRKTKEGALLDQRPMLVDAHLKKIDPIKTEIWGGSRIAVDLTVNPFSTAIGVGASLRMRGVQVIELVSGAGGGGVNFQAQDGYSDEEDLPAPQFRAQPTAREESPPTTPDASEF